MNDDLRLRRWLEAEHADREDEADALFTSVFASVRRATPADSVFTARTMAAVAEAARRDARRARVIRRIVVPVGATAAMVVAYLCSGLLFSALLSIVVTALDVLVACVVYAATAMSSEGDLWSVARTLGRATAALLTNSSVTTAILALQATAVIALVALQRLLRSDREFLP